MLVLKGLDNLKVNRKVSSNRQKVPLHLERTTVVNLSLSRENAQKHSLISSTNIWWVPVHTGQCGRQAGWLLELGLELQTSAFPQGLLLSVLGHFTKNCLLPPGQMLTFIMLARLATLCPVPVLQRVDRLIEPLRATCTAKVSPLPSPGRTCRVLCRSFMVTVYWESPAVQVVYEVVYLIIIIALQSTYS